MIDQIILSGSHMPEIFEHFKNKINESSILKNLKLSPSEYILVSTHREEIVDSSETLKSFINNLKNVSSHFNKKIIISTHPRTRNRLINLGINLEDKNLNFLKPFNFTDYINLQKNSFCVISDSGTIAEESSVLNFPAITIRPTHERPEVYDSGTLVISQISSENIIESINLSRKILSKNHINKVQDYQYRETSKIIVNNIFSLTAKINKYTWRK